MPDFLKKVAPVETVRAETVARDAVRLSKFLKGPEKVLMGPERLAVCLGISQMRVEKALERLQG